MNDETELAMRQRDELIAHCEPMNRIVIKSRNKAQTPSSLREWLMAQSLTQDPNDEVYYGVDTYVGVVRVKMLLKDIDKVCSIRTLKRLHGPIAQNFQMIPIINFP